MDKKNWFDILDTISIIAFGILLVGSILAIILTPSFDITQSYLSSLGNRKSVTTVVSGSHIQSSPHPEVFNSTLIICSILLLAPVFLQVFLLSPKSKGTSFVFLHGFWFAWILSMIAMATVAIADTGTNNFYHVIALTEFFGMAIIAITYRLVSVMSSPLKANFSKIDIANSFYLLLLGLSRATIENFWTDKVGDYIFQRFFILGFLVFIVELIRSNRKLISILNKKH